MRTGSALLSPQRVLDAAHIQEWHFVIESGTGRTGHTIFPASERVGKKGRVFGVDVAKDALHMLEGIRRQYLVHHVDFVWMDVEAHDALPFSEIDRVLLVNTAWMLKRRGETFSRIREILADHGAIVVVDWRPDARHAVAPRWDFRVHPQELDVELAHLGLRAVLRADVSPWHFVRMYQAF